MSISVRIVKMVLTHLFRIPFWAGRFKKYSLDPEVKGTQIVHEDFQTLVKSLNRAAKVDVQIHGLENLPEENGYVMYPNHQGLYDALALLAVLPRAFSIIYKIELQNVPFLRLALGALNAKAMDRKDVRQSMNVINTVAKEVAEEHRNYVIFAEGTRNQDGNNVHEMKGGSFKIATKAKCPIVPVALIDSYKPFDERSLKPVTLQVCVLPAISYEEYKSMKAVELAEEVRRCVQLAIIEHLPEDEKDTVRIDEWIPAEEAEMSEQAAAETETVQ